MQAQLSYKKLAYTFFVFSLLIFLTAVVLYLLGRRWWCIDGQFFVWAGASTPHTSQHIFDPYSFSHVLHGFIFLWILRLFLKKRPIEIIFIVAIGIECLGEIAENSPLIIERYRTATVALNYFGDSIANSISDIICAAFGFLFAAAVPWKVSLATLIVIEISLLFFIGDNLTLNIIMLINPVSFIFDKK